MNPIKLGVCGIGRFGRVHCRHFSKSPECYKLVAICDIVADRVNGIASEYGARGYTDFASFLADPQIELVIIATPSLHHVINTEQALAAGKIVLVEKPIGVTADDYKRLTRLVEQYPGRLYFCHNHRFEPAFSNTRDIIATGLLGKIHVVKLCKHHVFMRRNDWQMRLDCGGGQLSVWGPHLLDQGLQLLGGPVRTVHSYLRRILTPGDADDHVKVTLIGENDVVVEIEISNSVAIHGPYCTIYGDRGTLTYGQDQTEIHLKYLDPDFRWPDATATLQSPAPGMPMSADSELPWREEARRVHPDVNMWDYVEVELAAHLYRAIRQGVPFPIKASDALEVVRVTEVVKRQNPQFAWIG